MSGTGSGNDIFSFRFYPHYYFGAGSSKLVGEKAQELGGKKALVVADAGIVAAGLLKDILASLDSAGLSHEIYSDTEPEPSLDSVQRFADYCRGRDFDIMVVIGGGSCIDMAKAGRVLLDNPGTINDYFGFDKVKNPPRHPMIILATTAGSGSEVSIGSVISDKRNYMKPAVMDRHTAAAVTICDPLLTLSVPAAITASSGMDAFSHAIETFSSKKASVLTDLITAKAIELIARALPVATRNGNDLQARTDMLLGSSIAMIAGDNANWGLCHAFASPLGARFNVPHRIGIGIMLPHVVEFNTPALPEKFAKMAGLLGAHTEGLTVEQSAAMAAPRLREIIAEIGVPTRLRDVGAVFEVLPEVAKISAKSFHLITNPREVTETDILALMQKAF